MPTKRSPTLSDMGITRDRWRYVASFAGLGTMMDVAANLGGSPACGSDNYGLVRALWQQRYLVAFVLPTSKLTAPC